MQQLQARRAQAIARDEVDRLQARLEQQTEAASAAMRAAHSSASSGVDAPAVTSLLTPQAAAQTERAADLAAALFFSG